MSVFCSTTATVPKEGWMLQCARAFHCSMLPLTFMSFSCKHIPLHSAIKVPWALLILWLGKGLVLGTADELNAGEMFVKPPVRDPLPCTGRTSARSWMCLSEMGKVNLCIHHSPPRFAGTTLGIAKGTEDRMCSGSKEITFKHEPACCKSSLFLTSVSLSRAWAIPVVPVGLLCICVYVRNLYFTVTGSKYDAFCIINFKKRDLNWIR